MNADDEIRDDVARAAAGDDEAAGRVLHGTGDPAKLSGIGDEIERQREAKRRTAVEAGEMQPTADDVARVESAGARHAGQTDPATGQKLDALLARNALTSLGRLHPANVDRATRRANKIGPLNPAHRELKERAVQRRRRDGEA